MRQMTQADQGKAIAMYLAGSSMVAIAHELDTNYSAVRNVLRDHNVVARPSSHITETGRAAMVENGRRKKGTTWSNPESNRRLSESMLRRGESYAKGTTLKPSGYIEITRGPNKGRSQHDVFMEDHIGRRLLPDEVVHHIDRNRSNNALENLQLMTRAAHTALHRREDKKEEVTHV